MERHVIIGTAGHIDHGKTTLIKALTGRDTDRLKEEKERGITIDLGFTWLDLSDGERVGIIDVPGHEKFISNMTAGVVGMDLVLLVIAADEGVMPQTREHLAILQLLGVEDILVVLNKCDLVDEEWIEMIESQIREEADIEILRVSAKTGTGIEALKDRIASYVKNKNVMWKTSTFSRIPVDRVFSVKGSGTVITGTLLGGQIYSGQRMMIYPEQIPCRVRKIQVHGEEVPFCEAGQRSALNLIKADRRQSSDNRFVYRGDVIAPEGSMKVGRYVNVRLQLLPQSTRIIGHQTRLHFYSGTTEVLCRAVPLSCEEIRPGESAYVQLRLEEEAAFCPGDRFIVRFYSPLETIGGGTVLEMGDQRERKFHDRCLQRLEELEKKQKMNLLGTENDRDDTNQEDTADAAKNLQDQLHLEKKIMDELEVWLIAHPYRTGMSKTALFNQISRGKKEWNQILQKCLLILEEHGTICCVKKQHGNRIVEFIYPAGYEVKETKELCEVRKAFVTQDSGESIFFLSKRELEDSQAWNKRSQKSGKGQEHLDLLQEILNYFCEKEEITEVQEGVYTTRENAKKIIEKISSMLFNNQTITLGQTKEIFQTSRKNARLIFSYTDRIGLTVKEGAETERRAGRKWNGSGCE